MSAPRRGQAPTGYRWSDGKLEIVPEEAESVKLAFDLFLKERRKVQVARTLNQQGYRSRQGNPWSGQTVGKMLSDCVVIGEYVIKKTGEIVPCKPIVTKETWKMVQSLLAEQKDPKSRPSGKVVNALSGLVFCGACNDKMYPREGKFLCESCRNKIPEDDLEGVFIDELEEFWRERSPTRKPPTLKKSWPQMEAQKRRNLAESLVERFVIGDADIEIVYRFPNFLKEPTKDEEFKPSPAKSDPAPKEEPIYIRLPKPGERCSRTGLSRAKLNNLILPSKRNNYSPPVRSKVARDPGKERGARLIIWESLKAYLDQQGV